VVFLSGVVEFIISTVAMKVVFVKVRSVAAFDPVQSSPVQSSTSTFVQVAPNPAIVTNTIFTAVAIKTDPNIWAFNIQGIICKPSAS
jgi:hypothetical protein